MPDVVPAPVMKRRWRPWMIVLGILLLVSASVNSTKAPPTSGPYEAAGQLTGTLILLAVSLWLISAGWARDYTLGAQFRRLRRRTWYKLAGLGLVVMVIAAVGRAFAGWITAGILVTWVYWFGWTWISWRMASKLAEKQVGSRYQ